MRKRFFFIFQHGRYSRHTYSSWRQLSLSKTLLEVFVWNANKQGTHPLLWQSATGYFGEQTFANIMSLPVESREPVELQSPAPFVLVSLILFAGALFLFLTYLIGKFKSFVISFFVKVNVVQLVSFYLGSRDDSRRRRRRALEDLYTYILIEPY